MGAISLEFEIKNYSGLPKAILSLERIHITSVYNTMVIHTFGWRGQISYLFSRISIRDRAKQILVV